MTTQPSRPPRHLLLTYPRTASNLLLKLLALETQPRIHLPAPSPSGPRDGNGYFFMSNQFLKGQIGRGKERFSDWSPEEKREVKESTQDCFEQLRKYAEIAGQEGKVAFVKEHVHFLVEPRAQEEFLAGALGDNEERMGNSEQRDSMMVSLGEGREGLQTIGNDTIFPDEYLRTWSPTFLFRHPALVFPSYLRACQGIFSSSETQLTLFMTFTWQRRLHDWYLKQNTNGDLDQDVSWPVVLDADDIITKPEVVVRYCQILGIDPSKLRFEWAPKSFHEKKGMNPVLGRFLSCLNDSSGIQKDKVADDINIEVESVKWENEFGGGMGEKVKKWVLAAMPDYEVMRARRLQA